MPASMADSRKIAKVQTSTGIVAEAAVFNFPGLVKHAGAQASGSLSRRAAPGHRHPRIGVCGKGITRPFVAQFDVVNIGRQAEEAGPVPGELGQGYESASEQVFPET